MVYELSVLTIVEAAGSDVNADLLVYRLIPGTPHNLLAFWAIPGPVDQNPDFSECQRRAWT